MNKTFFRAGILAVSLVAIAACGSNSGTDTTSDTNGSDNGTGNSSGGTADTTAPTITSITISGGKATPSSTSLSASATTTGVSTATSTFTITFSEAMDDTTVTASNVTLSCDVSATVSKTSSTVYVITPSANFTPLSSCTMTIGTGVKDATGNALASTENYAFNVACNTNDSFGTDSLSSCWTADNSPTASIGSGVLAFTQIAATIGAAPMEYKPFGSDDLTITVMVSSFSGITEDGDVCAIGLIDGTTDTIGAIVKVMLDDSDGTGLVVNKSTITGASSSSTSIALAGSSDSSLSDPLYLRLTQTGTSVISSYRIGTSGDFIPVGTVTASFGATKRVGLAIMSDGVSGAVNCSFDDFSVTGGSTTGQD